MSVGRTIRVYAPYFSFQNISMQRNYFRDFNENMAFNKGEIKTNSLKYFGIKI